MVSIIFSNLTDWKFIIERHKCDISVNPTNTNQISLVIQWIFDNPEKALEMGKRGQN